MIARLRWLFWSVAYLFRPHPKDLGGLAVPEDAQDVEAIQALRVSQRFWPLLGSVLYG